MSSSLPSPVQIGIDFGGTKIEAAGLDFNGNFIARIRSRNPGQYESSIRTVCDLVSQIEEQVGSRGTVGIGVPGSLSPRTGLMRNANSVWLNGRRFHEDLANALGREVRLANDANCLALSESVDGAAQGSNVTFAIVLGTGCGGGLVVNGQLIEGANGIGGEWGHIPLPWPTHDELPMPPCWCGQRGCLETWVSGSGLQRDFFQHTGRELNGEAIVSAARKGDGEAESALKRYVSRLGRALAVISNVVDPDTIVLGGGLSNVNEIYEALPEVIAAHTFCDGWRARVLPAKWGDSSGVRGAARLWHGAKTNAAQAASR